MKKRLSLIVFLLVLFVACESTPTDGNKTPGKETETGDGTGGATQETSKFTFKAMNFHASQPSSSNPSQDNDTISADLYHKSLGLYYYNHPRYFGLGSSGSAEVKKKLWISLSYFESNEDTTWSLEFESPTLAGLELKSWGSWTNLPFGNFYTWSTFGFNRDTWTFENHPIPDDLQGAGSPEFVAGVKYGENISATLNPLASYDVLVSSPAENSTVDFESDMTVQFASELAKGSHLGLFIYPNYMSIDSTSFNNFDNLIGSDLWDRMHATLELDEAKSSVVISKEVLAELKKTIDELKELGYSVSFELFAVTKFLKHDEIDLKLSGNNKPLNVMVTSSYSHMLKID